MASVGVTESVVEDADLAWLESVGWRVAHGLDIAPDMPAAERAYYGEVVLAQRLREALARLNPQLPAEALKDAFRKLTRPEGTELVERNRALHRLLVNGVTVEYRDPDGAIRGAQARAIDFDDPSGNDWLAVNQFSVVENRHSRRPDVVLIDDQLFGTFSRCQDLLRQPPVQAESRAHLRQLLSVQADGVVFTTIHKFFSEEKGNRHPTLSDRHNIVVIADEAHRSQYDFVDSFARHMRDALPHASFIGFTGTPIERADACTRAVFGDTISIYDIQRTVQDGVTVPIYYESRLAKLSFDEAERPKMLEQTIRRYQNRAIEAAQVIEELIQLAKEMREASARGEQLGLSEDELSFYDALKTNDSAVKILGDTTLRAIARELVETVCNNVTIDWTLRGNARAQLRVLVKRILRKHSYPPDKQEKATQTVLEQAALLSTVWAAA